MSSKNLPLQDSRLRVHKGEKGRLITAHDNPRMLQDDDPMVEFVRCLGGEDKAKVMLARFKMYNEGDKGQKTMADGLITTMITQNKVTKRTLAAVLKVGSGRIKRIRDGKSKTVDYGHLNGNQVCF